MFRGRSFGHPTCSLSLCDCDDQRAVENGAVPVSEPQEKEWGQKVGYVRDIDGLVVRMGSYVAQPKSKSN